MINPREPLTNKARSAIRQYAAIKGEKVHHIQYFMVDAVLEAERMKRKELYAWLEKKGYQWRAGYWLKRSKSSGRTSKN